MARGDYVEAVVVTPSGAFPVRVTASKAGRTVMTKYTAKWLDIMEVSRPTHANPRGRPAGAHVRVRIDALVSVDERRSDDEPTPAKPRRPKDGTIPMELVSIE